MALSWRKPPLTQAEENDLFMLTLEDDTEDAPWMVMGDLQFDAASSFKHSLREYARAHGLRWYVASMVPIRYRWGQSRRRRQLSPDGFVAFVSDHRRSSYDLEAEGGFPPFVLEIVSPASVEHDEQDKLQAYGVLGAREYVLFTPREDGSSTLAGFRRDTAGLLVAWPQEDDGSLWSEVLGLRLVAAGALLLAETADGERLLSPEQEAAARRAAEAENERLRNELARVKHDKM
jgi:Uma2 family endonuclease